MKEVAELLGLLYYAGWIYKLGKKRSGQHRLFFCGFAFEIAHNKTNTVTAKKVTQLLGRRSGNARSAIDQRPGQGPLQS